MRCLYIFNRQYFSVVVVVVQKNRRRMCNENENENENALMRLITNDRHKNKENIKIVIGLEAYFVFGGNL